MKSSSVTLTSVIIVTITSHVNAQNNGSPGAAAPFCPTKYYRLFQAVKLNWEDAIKACQASALQPYEWGNLASVRTDDEQNQLEALNAPEEAWIGAYNVGWYLGRPADSNDYLLWKWVGYPEGFQVDGFWNTVYLGSSENGFASFWRAPDDGTTATLTPGVAVALGVGADHGKWDPEANKEDTKAYICEYCTIHDQQHMVKNDDCVPDVKRYQVVTNQQLTWADAQQTCQEMASSVERGNLAKASTPAAIAEGNGNDVWVGATATSGEWKWTTVDDSTDGLLALGADDSKVMGAHLDTTGAIQSTEQSLTKNFLCEFCPVDFGRTHIDEVPVHCDSTNRVLIQKWDRTCDKYGFQSDLIPEKCGFLREDAVRTLAQHATEVILNAVRITLDGVATISSASAAESLRNGANWMSVQDWTGGTVNDWCWRPESPDEDEFKSGVGRCIADDDVSIWPDMYRSCDKRCVSWIVHPGGDFPDGSGAYKHDALHFVHSPVEHSNSGPTGDTLSSSTWLQLTPEQCAPPAPAHEEGECPVERKHFEYFAHQLTRVQATVACGETSYRHRLGRLATVSVNDTEKFQRLGANAASVITGDNTVGGPASYVCEYCLSEDDSLVKPVSEFNGIETNPNVRDGYILVEGANGGATANAYCDTHERMLIQRRTADCDYKEIQQGRREVLGPNGCGWLSEEAVRAIASKATSVHLVDVGRGTATSGGAVQSLRSQQNWNERGGGFGSDFNWDFCIAGGKLANESMWPDMFDGDNGCVTWTGAHTSSVSDSSADNADPGKKFLVSETWLQMKPGTCVYTLEPTAEPTVLPQPVPEDTSLHPMWYVIIGLLICLCCICICFVGFILYKRWKKAHPKDDEDEAAANYMKNRKFDESDDDGPPVRDTDSSDGDDGGAPANATGEHERRQAVDSDLEISDDASAAAADSDDELADDSDESL